MSDFSIGLYYGWLKSAIRCINLWKIAGSTIVDGPGFRVRVGFRVVVKRLFQGFRIGPSSIVDPIHLP